MGKKTARNPRLEEDIDLVLKEPNHYHVKIFVYQAATQDGNFQNSTECDLIDTDLDKAITRAVKIAAIDDDVRAMVHMRYVHECDRIDCPRWNSEQGQRKD